MQTYIEFLDDVNDLNRYGADTHVARTRILEWITYKNPNQILNLLNLDLHTLPPLLPTIKNLRIGGPQLVYVPKGSLPTELEDLMCSYCASLRKLPPMPMSLKSINIAYSNISQLPRLPPTIKRIVADSTPLLSIPYLYEGLESLSITHTSVKTLGCKKLPDSLRNLEIDYTPITKLPELGSNLHTLCLNGTKVMVLPHFPISLRQLWITNCSSLHIQPTDALRFLNLDDLFNYGQLWSIWHSNEAEKKRHLKRFRTVRLELIGKTLNKID